MTALIILAAVAGELALALAVGWLIAGRHHTHHPAARNGDAT